MYNPFREDEGQGVNNVLLVREALGGDKVALERLIALHQAWIYNIARKMVFDPDDAKDVTQEILIKMITKLSTYDPDKAAFRTWLYRIVANHVITMKRKRLEERFSMQRLDSGDWNDPVNEIADERPASRPDYKTMVDESRISCLNGILFCLNREQRLVFVLGVIFNVTDVLGSEMMGISRTNFRKILSRSRKRIFNFLNDRCSLINENNPCRCDKAIDTQIRMGLMHPDRKLSNGDYALTVNGALSRRLGESTEKYYKKYVNLIREQPFYNSPELSAWLREEISSDDFKDMLQLDGGDQMH